MIAGCWDKPQARLPCSETSGKSAVSMFVFTQRRANRSPDLTSCTPCKDVVGMRTMASSPFGCLTSELALEALMQE